MTVIEKEMREKVWVRGRFSEQFSMRGEVEVVDCRAEAPYGVRFENGNFLWVRADQIRGRSVNDAQGPCD